MSPRELNRQEKAWESWGTFYEQTFDNAEVKKTMEMLPGINREARILLGQVPGMRAALNVYFRMRRVMHGYNQYLEGEGLGQLYLTLAATAVLLLHQVLELQRKYKQEQEASMILIQRERNLTHDQFVSLQKNWKSYRRGQPG